MPELSIVFPLYNEQENIPHVIPPVISVLEGRGIDYELVLVDNGSRDRTGELLRELAAQNKRLKTVRVEVNQGYGWGIICGLNHAVGEYVGYMGSDGQILPQDIVRVYDMIKQDGLEFAKVKRVSRGDGWIRKINTLCYNNLFYTLFRVRSFDINGTPKIFKHTLLDKFNPVSKDWFLDAELMIKAQAMGIEVGEVPVNFLPRKGGRSNVKLHTVQEFLDNMWEYRFGGKADTWKKLK